MTTVRFKTSLRILMMCSIMRPMLGLLRITKLLCEGFNVFGVAIFIRRVLLLRAMIKAGPAAALTRDVFVHPVMFSLLGIQMLMIILMMILRLIMKLSIVKDIILVRTGAMLSEKSLFTKTCALPIIQILLVIIDLDMLHKFLLISLPFGRGAVNI